MYTTSMIHRGRGFTIVELLIVIIVIAILATLTIVSYGTWQQRTAQKAVVSDLTNASSSLESYMNFNSTYTRNMGGTGFVSSTAVGIVPYTNATTTIVQQPYSGLTASQNTELFIYSCNSEMQLLSRSCSLIGNNNGAKIHVPGTSGSNTQWPGKICYPSGGSGCSTVLTADCSGVPIASCNKIIDSFQQQGGTFPIDLSSGRSNLPPQITTEEVDDNIAITKYCLQGQSTDVSQVVYRVTDEKKVPEAGTCDAYKNLHDLQYFQ